MVALPLCGAMMQLLIFNSAWERGRGSGSKTSNAAESISPVWSAATKASVSTTGPRAIFTRIADFFHLFESLSIDDVARLWRAWADQHYVVGTRQQVVQGTKLGAEVTLTGLAA